MDSSESLTFSHGEVERYHSRAQVKVTSVKHFAGDFQAMKQGCEQALPGKKSTAVLWWCWTELWRNYGAWLGRPVGCEAL